MSATGKALDFAKFLKINFPRAATDSAGCYFYYLVILFGSLSQSDRQFCR
jgi:hypothetical protein